MRDHSPIVIEEFNGFWARGDADSCPIDHSPHCNNIDFIESGIRTRDGLDTLVAKADVVRMYNYVLPTGDSLLELDSNGRIWHSLLDGSNITYGPILTIPGMTDFAFIAINSYAYISPFNSTPIPSGISLERGLQNEFVYVYKGDGTIARKAAGFPPTNPEDTPFVAYNSSIDGVVDQGIHVLAVTFSSGGATDSTGLGTTVKPVIYAPGGRQIIVNNLPIGPLGITQRKVWMTKLIDPKDWNPDTTTYTYYLATTINDNTSTDTIIDIADANLVTPFAAGALPNPTSGGLTAENSDEVGYCDLGLHVIGVLYETDTGFLTAPGPEVLAVQTFVNELRGITVKNIPVSPDPFVIGRRLVASKAISLYNGDDRGFQLFLIPEGNIEDNTTTEFTVSFFDAELLEDASHLIDNFSEIPAFAVLSSFHQRLVGAAEYNDISIARLSASGEPEAINQVDGFLTMARDGNGITNAIEFRDILYLFKQTKTQANADDGVNEPQLWPKPIVIDNGIGASIHGIGTVLDSMGVNIDFLLIADYSGVMIFNGAYQRPELSWKVRDFWFALDRTLFNKIEIYNDSLNQRIYVLLPNGTLLYGNYQWGLNFKKIKWMPWEFDIVVSTMALINKDTLALATNQLVP